MWPRPCWGREVPRVLAPAAELCSRICYLCGQDREVEQKRTKVPMTLRRGRTAAHSVLGPWGPLGVLGAGCAWHVVLRP